MRAKITLRACKTLTRGNKTWTQGRPEVTTDDAEIRAAQADGRFSVTILDKNDNGGAASGHDPATETADDPEVAAPISERPLKAERTPVREGPAGKVVVRKKSSEADD